MATRRRRNTRRRNPVRATGALILNPSRRRNKSTKRRANTSRRRNMSSAARSRAAKKGWAKRKRNGTKRGQRRRTAKRAYAPKRRRTNTTRRRNTARRRNPVARRRNTSRRRSNPSALTNLKRSLKKLPVVGGPLSDMVGFGPYAAFGAVGVEPTMMLAKYFSPYMPRVNSSVFYAGTGLLVAAIIGRFAPVSPAVRQKLAIAVASAAGGVAYYKWRTGTDASMAGEYGLLEYGDAGAYAVAPF